MRIFKINTHRIENNENLISIFAKSKEVVTKTNSYDFRRLFYFSDSGLGKISATKRAIKKFPLLEKFEYYAPEENVALPAHYVLSNLSKKEWQESNPNGINDDIDLEILEGVASGIPRSFPFYFATFVFDKVDWFLDGKIANMPSAIGEGLPSARYPTGTGYFSPSILFQSNWSTGRRKLTLYTVIELNTPKNNNDSLSEINSNAQKLIEKLGKVKSEMIHAVPTVEEANQIKTKNKKAINRVAAFKEDIDSILDDISMSYSLSDVPSLNETVGNLKLKSKLLSIFCPLGFKYLSSQSGQGVYFLAKKTKNNNQFSLLFDLAPLARTLSWVVIIQGPFWKHGLELKFFPDTPYQCTVNEQNTLNKLIENAGKIYSYLEKSILTEIEELYGPAPHWFEYQK
jgi:hypothetical protein